MLPPEHALVLADDVEPVLDDRRVPGRQRRRRGARAAAPSGSSTARASAGTSTTTASGTAPSARSRRATARTLVAEWLPALDGVVAKLEAGALVADVGCGHGASTILMAQAFPASRFVGDRLPRGSIATARERAARGGRRRPRDVRGRGRGGLRGRGLRPRRVLRLVPRPRRPARRRAPRRRGARARRHVHARRAVRGRPGGGQPQPDRPLLLRVLDARLHARLAVAARPRRARHPGRRGGAARGAAGRRLRHASGAPPRRRSTSSSRRSCRKANPRSAPCAAAGLRWFRPGDRSTLIQDPESAGAER